MKLEKEIKQKKFRSEYQKLAVNIFYTQSWLNNLHSGMLKEHKLTIQQFNILRILRGQYPNPAPLILLKDRMLDKMSDASRLVDRLYNKGLVERVIDPEDRRKIRITISDKGLDVLSKIDGKESHIENNMKNLTIKEAKLINELLDKLRG